MQRTSRMWGFLLGMMSACWAQDTLLVIQTTAGTKLHGWEVSRVEGRSILMRLPSHQGLVIPWRTIVSIEPSPQATGAVVDQDTLPVIPQREPETGGWFYVDRSGRTWTELRLDSARGEMLFASTGADKRRTRVAIPIRSIRQLGFRAGSGFLRGALIGAGFGGLLGGAIGAVSYQPKPNALLDFGPGFAILGGASAGVIGGFIVGGIAGAASQYEQHDDLSTLDSTDAVTVVHHLFYDSLH